METPHQQTRQKGRNVKFLSTIDAFFTYASPKQHLAFLAKWHEMIFNSKYEMRDVEKADLLYRYKHFEELFEAAYRISLSGMIWPGKVILSGKAQDKFLLDEPSFVDYYPTWMSHDQLVDPLEVIKGLFADQSLEYYKEVLFEGLTDVFMQTPQALINDAVVQVFETTKHLIDACWLIHTRERFEPEELSDLTPELDDLVYFITSVMPVAYIFCLKHEPGSTDLMVIPDAQCRQSFTELQPLIEFATIGFPNVKCTLHNLGVLHDMLKNRMLFYVEASTPEKCIYQKSRAGFPVVNASEYLQLKASASLIFEKGMAKVRDFYEGAVHLVKTQRYALVPFMLHQSCELTFRLVCQVMGGNAIRCHDLIVLRKRALRFFDGLAGIFSENEEEECRLLNMLGTAYTRSRYEQDYCLEKHYLSLFLAQTALLQEKVRSFFNNYLTPLNSISSDQSVLVYHKDAGEDWF